MGIFSKFLAFGAQATPPPHEEINALTAAVAAAHEPGVSESQTLEQLRATVNRHAMSRDLFALLERAMPPVDPKLATLEHIITCHVAIGDTVLALSGRDPNEYSNDRDPEERAKMKEFCALNKSRLDTSAVQKSLFRDLLWRTFGTKHLWRINQDPRSRLTTITNTEQTANESFNREHKAPWLQGG
jgi:hypothetical protein